MRRFVIVCAVAAAAGFFPVHRLGATVVNIPANKDNTIYSEGIAASNGAGDNFFAGATGSGTFRRALISFAVADSLPQCAVIQGVTLTLHMSRTVAGSQVVTLHKLLENWGEGTSDATGQEGIGATASIGDATWTYTFYNTLLWSTPGGTFSSTVSGSQNVDAVGFYTWTNPQMVADVQLWTDSPATNFGWIVIGNEAVSATAKRFDSRTNPTLADRPVLTVTFFDCTAVEPATWGTIKSIFK